MSDLMSRDFKIFTTLRYDSLLNDHQSNSLLVSATPSLHQCSPFYMPLYHRDRLLQASRYFGWSKATEMIEGERGMVYFLSKLERVILKSDLIDPQTPLRIKVVLSHDGSIMIEKGPTPALDICNLYPQNLNEVSCIKSNPRSLEDKYSSRTYILHVSRNKVSPDEHTHYKTTRRTLYSLAQHEVKIQGMLGQSEVLLVNLLGEVMEGSFTTVYFWRSGSWVTPYLKAGGQEGTTRRWALSQGLCVEGIIKSDSLVSGEICCISNGLRGLFEINQITSTHDKIIPLEKFDWFHGICRLKLPNSSSYKTMAIITAVSLTHASRLCLRQSALASKNCRNSNALWQKRIPNFLSSQRRCISEMRKNYAQVDSETSHHIDQSSISAEYGKFPTSRTPLESSRSKVDITKPMSDVLKQATIADQGERPIYLDMQATTPVDPRVLDKMLPYYCGLYGNPHSRTHAYGWETEKAVEDARKNIADLIGADPKEIIFTSGATESNNMSIKGVARFCSRSDKKNHIITTQTEHKCVLDSCRHLQDEQFAITYLPVQSNGLIDLKVLEKAFRPETALVSIMSVNNEIGVIQPMEEIGQMCRERKVFFHTDAAQAVGKIPIDVNKLKIDLMSISSHKIYGPKGIGACYVRRRPRVRLEPLFSGGGQERGLRSGTLAPALSVGFGEACRIAKEEMDYDSKRIKMLSDRLLKGLLSMEHTVQNGDPKTFYPGCVNVSFSYVEGESLLMALKDIALSSGSACTSASLEPSYVLRALGSSDESAHSSIRFGIGRFTTESEIDYVLKAVKERVTFLRELSPLWELVQEGVDLNTIQWSQH
ncbi:Cysteine desulfurase, mitochondrial [Golovinomyces cichoracearum]|uniref:cysteine desulfurase n=1 Tax=Golovinomyces cichoracearum TaxID=62708 RepID=A0A420J702_9PEZI|nr:Cysteine desulfurase, mitochondrial [Golovinomyces cichoracearum]